MHRLHRLQKPRDTLVTLIPDHANLPVHQQHHLRAGDGRVERFIQRLAP